MRYAHRLLCVVTILSLTTCPSKLFSQRPVVIERIDANDDDVRGSSEVDSAPITQEQLENPDLYRDNDANEALVELAPLSRSILNDVGTASTGASSAKSEIDAEGIAVLEIEGSSRLTTTPANIPLDRIPYFVSANSSHTVNSRYRVEGPELVFGLQDDGVYTREIKVTVDVKGIPRTPLGEHAIIRVIVLSSSGSTHKVQLVFDGTDWSYFGSYWTEVPEATPCRPADRHSEPIDKLGADPPQRTIVIRDVVRKGEVFVVQVLQRDSSHEGFTTGDADVDSSSSYNVRCTVKVSDEVVTNFPGDINGDCYITFADIGPFLLRLNGASLGGYDHAADINCDGEVNFLDITPFINLLSTMDGIFLCSPPL